MWEVIDTTTLLKISLKGRDNYIQEGTTPDGITWNFA